jgi:type II secretory pathway component PulK
MLHTLSHSSRSQAPRRGVVLLAVLVMIVLLSLAAFNYLDLMTAEYKASDNYHKTAQARAFADSGIHYAMAVLSNPDNVTNLLNGNPYDNAGVFKNHLVTQANDKNPGYFTLVAPLSPNNSAAVGNCQFGVIDESSKININAMMVLDPTGEKLYNMLLQLPNMTADIANSIIDWVDTDTTPRQGGAESDYYSGLSPPYNCKNGPLDSIEELLLVKGVTPQLLFGADLNRNGYQDSGETNSESSTASGFDRGWSALLTIHSREQNVDPTGLALTNLNDSSVDLATMQDTLSTKLSDDLAKFIIMYRQYGPYNSPAPTKTVTAPPTSGKGGSTSQQIQYGSLGSYSVDATKKASQKISSLYDLVNAQVSIPNKDPKKPATVYKSPLSDPGQQADLLPKLFQSATIFAAAEIPARINVNTAPQEVIASLPGLSAADVQAIMEAQPQYSGSDTPDPVYQTPAWLIMKANVSPATLSKLERYVTTRSQVYRVQSLGFFDAAKGPVVRLEAVIDANGGQPRILSWRDLADFGRVRPPQ